MTSHPASPGQADAPAYFSHRQVVVVLGGLMAGMFLAALDISIVGVALPRIVSELGGLNHLSWVVTVYLLTSTASTPLWGKISDLYGRRPVFQTAILVFLLGSVVAAVAPDIGTLIAGRAVQGLGSGGLLSLGFAVLADVIPPRERGRYQGYFGSVFGTASVAGPLLGGWFTDGLGWRWIFWINLPVGLAALIVTSLALRRMRTVRRDRQVDYAGATVIVAAVSCLLLYLTWAGVQRGWGDPLSVGLLAAGTVLTAAFLWVESRAAEPILPLDLFAINNFRWMNLYVSLVGIAMFGAVIFMPLYFQVVQGMSPMRSGLALIPNMAGILSTSIAIGHVTTRTGRYKVFPVAGAALLVVALLLLSRVTETTPYWQVGVALYLLGMGMGCSMQTALVAVQNAVDDRHMGTATSAVTFFRSLGGAFGTALFGAVLNARLTHHLADRFAGSATFPGSDVVNDVNAIAALPDAVRAKVIDAFVAALQDVFLSGVPFMALAFVVGMVVHEQPLRGRASTH